MSLDPKKPGDPTFYIMFEEVNNQMMMMKVGIMNLYNIYNRFIMKFEKASEGFEN